MYEVFENTLGVRYFRPSLFRRSDNGRPFFSSYIFTSDKIKYTSYCIEHTRSRPYRMEPIQSAASNEYGRGWYSSAIGNLNGLIIASIYWIKLYTWLRSDMLFWKSNLLEIRLARVYRFQIHFQFLLPHRDPEALKDHKLRQCFSINQFSWLRRATLPAIKSLLRIPLTGWL